MIIDQLSRTLVVTGATRLRTRPFTVAAAGNLIVVTEDGFTIRLTHDQALVLSDWLYRVMGTADFDRIVSRDRAVWSPLYQISGGLETSLAEVFAPDYGTRLEAARERLLDTLGEVSRPIEDGRSD